MKMPELNFINRRETRLKPGIAILAGLTALLLPGGLLLVCVPWLIRRSQMGNQRPAPIRS